MAKDRITTLLQTCFGDCGLALMSPDVIRVRSEDQRGRVLTGNGFAVGSMILWAAGFPAAEILLEDWHPISLMMMRLIMALSVLLPLWVLIDGRNTVVRARWRRGIWIGMVGFGTGTNLLLFAQWFTDPVTVALIATTTPIAAAIVEFLARTRHYTVRFAIGLAASVAGGAVAVGGNFTSKIGWGILMAIGSGFCFAWASHVTVRDFPDLSPVGRSAITFVGAALFTFVILGIGSWLNEVELPSSISARQVLLLAVYSIAAMALAQILFLSSVGRIGIALTSFHINAAPFYVMLMLVALGGAWDWQVAAGAVIVGIGVLIAQGRKGR